VFDNETLEEICSATLDGMSDVKQGDRIGAFVELEDGKIFFLGYGRYGEDATGHRTRRRLHG
jgi:hypothetical protein